MHLKSLLMYLISCLNFDLPSTSRHLIPTYSSRVYQLLHAISMCIAGYRPPPNTRPKTQSQSQAHAQAHEAAIAGIFADEGQCLIWRELTAEVLGRKVHILGHFCGPLGWLIGWLADWLIYCRSACLDLEKSEITTSTRSVYYYTEAVLCIPKRVP